MEVPPPPEAGWRRRVPLFRKRGSLGLRWLGLGSCAVLLLEPPFRSELRPCEAKWLRTREKQAVAMEGPPRPQTARREGVRGPSEALGPALSSFAGTLPTAKMSSAWVTSFEKEHLWRYLLALGFEPGPATIACGKIVSHTHLGV